ncbi:hypothetical protein [Aeromicrobium sp. Root472D3]|uniref:hypothetical protein n=1 Tax=Aeromicrobium sp. Root472D3 TaxID=1736540 RepID=UPI0006FF42CF|nr:hypothetical protein [Aeromicrobium sp. Root472D3]KQX76042.1 hypothetical protein ASD10_13180 [Aeromicrobium sp. Root472D3]
MLLVVVAVGSLLYAVVFGAVWWRVKDSPGRGAVFWRTFVGQTWFFAAAMFVACIAGWLF